MTHENTMELCGIFKLEPDPEGDLLSVATKKGLVPISTRGYFKNRTSPCSGCQVQSAILGKLTKFAGRCAGGKVGSNVVVGRGQGDNLHHYSSND